MPCAAVRVLWGRNAERRALASWFGGPGGAAPGQSLRLPRPSPRALCGVPGAPRWPIRNEVISNGRLRHRRSDLRGRRPRARSPSPSALLSATECARGTCSAWRPSNAVSFAVTTGVRVAGRRALVLEEKADGCERRLRAADSRGVARPARQGRYDAPRSHFPPCPAAWWQSRGAARGGQTCDIAGCRRRARPCRRAGN